MNTNDIDLDHIEKLADAATKGPWTLRDGWGPARDGLARCSRIANGDHDNVLFPEGRDVAGTVANLEFIAAARGAVPALIAEIRRLREQLYAQKPVIDAAKAWAELRETEDVTPTEARKLAGALHEVIEQYRLMDAALTAARNEQPAEVTR